MNTPNRRIAGAARIGKWPVLIEMQPEACNQATRQLWGPQGVNIHTARHNISAQSFFFFHLYFHSQKWHGIVNKRAPLDLDRALLMHLLSVRESSVHVCTGLSDIYSPECVWGGEGLGRNEKT